MLCSVQLGDLIDVLNKSRWVVGDKFPHHPRSASIPTETHETAFDNQAGLPRIATRRPRCQVSERFKARGVTPTRAS